MAKSGKGGQPRKYSDNEIEEYKKKFEEYIDNNPIPIIAEFAYQNNILRETIYDYNEFATLRKKAIAKKESNLEKGALSNKLNPSMAIFSLKQLGWTDKKSIEIASKKWDDMSKAVETWSKDVDINE